MSATETKGMALVTSASARIGAMCATAKVASPWRRAPRTPWSRARSCRRSCGSPCQTWPAMLAITMVAIVETVYVGILGTTPLAALVFPLIMLMQMLSAGAMGGGVSSAISRALGAGVRLPVRQASLQVVDKPTACRSKARTFVTNHMDRHGQPLALPDPQLLEPFQRECAREPYATACDTNRSPQEGSRGGLRSPQSARCAYCQSLPSDFE